MRNNIKKFFNMEYEIDSKIFRKALVLYPYSPNSISSSYLANITKVWATQKYEKTTVHIKTHRPGILIGKAGELINEIKKLMETMYKNSISIDIQEEKMFLDIYD
jgi:ribosomal protein S3